MSSPILYEINTRSWLNELSDRHGRRVTLATVPESEVLRWHQLGFSHIWLMGVWTAGARTRAGALAFIGAQPEYQDKSPEELENLLGSSPYAIAEYQVPELLGGEAGLQAFRRRLKDRGLRLILDYVPNHVGLDHPWLSRRPELFVSSSSEMPGTFAQLTKTGGRWIAHGRDPYLPPWSDTAQLDYRLSATRAAMLETLLGIAGKCDGVRCDMAMLVLNDVFAKTWAQVPPCPGHTHPSDPRTEFWQEAIAATKKTRPHFLFLAEVYWGLEARLQSLGFDYTYDKELYDAIVRRNPADVQGHLLDLPARSVESSAHFLENHDEPRIASILSAEEHRAAALLILSLPGMRFLYEGQLTGACVKTPVQLMRSIPEPPRIEIQRLYEQLLGALQKTAVGKGNGLILKPREAWPGNSTSQHFVVTQWETGAPEFDLAAINLSPQRSQCYAPLAIKGLAEHHWLMKDLLGSEEYIRSGKDLQSQGLYLDVPAHAAQLFHFAPKQAMV